MKPTSMPYPWNRLAEAEGGVASLALFLGVTTMTLWRWSHGKTTPTRTQQLRINSFAAKAGVRRPYK